MAFRYLIDAELARAAWKKSSRSGESGGNCVEVADLSWGIGVRDSKNPTGPMLILSHSQWENFLRGVKQGEFDV